LRPLQKPTAPKDLKHPLPPLKNEDEDVARERSRLEVGGRYNNAVVLQDVSKVYGGWFVGDVCAHCCRACGNRALEP
jgi:hypothetical protein